MPSESGLTVRGCLHRRIAAGSELMHFIKLGGNRLPNARLLVDSLDRHLIEIEAGGGLPLNSS